MNKFQQIPISTFFSKFIKDCEEYDEMDHVITFEGVTLTAWFLGSSQLPDKKYSAVLFGLDDHELVVFDHCDAGGEKVVYSRLIECSLR